MFSGVFRGFGYLGHHGMLHTRPAATVGPHAVCGDAAALALLQGSSRV